ncbi:uncharacterized protein si:ch211-180a12.2 [Conger conger]|uniref:uncharacterized protein si:ch211-180a12.2 n=1 Tax=Conger conger TaxID=82655 RepID=UPI002A599288|nr:uncharacterized protein si:ch211-180a12.2 [Conger conger]XP_061088495.1 uncharacterized protein si:ch211-180a12.2 [Conger conger]XP_061088496.1 uncharacterized protein si:ch211-180a12.2 [Conger conger]XP_061088497.1 uncharacterized protein si:ch211-180a12.2 [Conger conger]
MVVLHRENEIKCLAQGFTPPLIYFSWMKGGEEVRPPRPFTAVNHTSDGYFWAVSSLALTPTAEDKYINFSCVVNHAALQKPLAIELPLNFTQLPTVTLSTIPADSPSSPLTLSCDIEEFYPKEITVQWVQNGSILPDPPLVLPSPGGTFRTRHFRTLNKEERERSGEVQCVVWQPSVPEPISATVDLFITDTNEEGIVLTKSAKASVALMIISLVLVLLLCFGFSWRKRDEKQKSLSVSGIILPPRVIVGQKGRVTVSVEGRRVDRVQTTWFLNDKLISDTSQTVTEKGPLLPPGGEVGYYKLHTQRPLLSGNGSTQQLLSSLSFIPHLSIHKGAVFKCQVSYMGKDKVVVERVSDKFTLLAAPKVSDIQLTDPADSSGIVTLTAQASGFHPDIITFRWFCQGGELSPVAPPAPLSAPRPDAQGFFSAISQCKLPRTELERGETKVWVTVHHMALKQPITRETRGFIKRPHVSDIISYPAASSHSPKDPLIFGCEVTGFYPPDISVSWWRIIEEQDEEEIEECGDIWGPLLTHPSTYRATATLRVESSEKREREKTRIACRVMHCSLQEPIERQWQNSHSDAPSIPSSLSVQWKKGGIGVFSLTLLGGHPKAKLLWAAGGATLSPLVSTESQVEGEDGTRELKSVCTIQRSSGRGGQTDRYINSQRNRHTHLTEEAVTNCGIDGIEIVDEKDDGEIKMEQKRPGTPAVKRRREGEDEESEDEKKRGKESDIPMTNTVNVRREDKGGNESLRVSVEITHPALALPIYRTWTEPQEES